MVTTDDKSTNFSDNCHNMLCGIRSERLWLQFDTFWLWWPRRQTSNVYSHCLSFCQQRCHCLLKLPLTQSQIPVSLFLRLTACSTIDFSPSLTACVPEMKWALLSLYYALAVSYFCLTFSFSLSSYHLIALPFPILPPSICFMFACPQLTVSLFLPVCSSRTYLQSC